MLKSQPNSIEAINNKAWILHTYMDQSRQALELVLALQKRVNSAALPGEFYDTLGSIQESIGKIREAEQAYTDGLKKAPEHPVLNFHFGKMIAADRSRAGKARPYLKKALDWRPLSPPMTQEATRLVQLIDAEARSVTAGALDRPAGQRQFTPAGVIVVDPVELGRGIAAEVLFRIGRLFRILTQVAFPLPVAGADCRRA